MKKKCSKCKAEEGFLSSISVITLKGNNYCLTCAKAIIEDGVKDIIITTTNNVDGYKVAKYIDIISEEVVIGTGLFTEFNGNMADLFGARSTGFEKKLQDAKDAGFKKLKFKAFEKDGNAVIGVDIDYTSYSGNRTGVIVNGTVVRIEKI